MYSASNAFHTAVANGAPQKALLLFADAIFSNEDIDVDGGIEMDDYFNTEEDIAIGQALSNEIRFGLFNDARLLNNYAFGDFTATIGARIGTGTYSDNSLVTVYDGDNIWRGRNTSPYLTRNGSSLTSGPTYPIRCIMIYNDKVYCFGTSNRYKVYTTGGTVVSETLNSFVTAKAQNWFGVGINLNTNTRIMKEYSNGKSETYEFVPLGKFVAKRPNVPDVNLISFTCHDFMTKFDKDMPTASALGISYPTTISNLFVKLCQYAGVSYQTSTFINSTATISKEPDKFENATMRDVLQWIAEAGAANLRFNRDGVLVFDWLRSTNQSLDEGDYSEFNPYWYETTTVTKVVNRSSESGEDKTYGSGSVGYLIQDNPLLEGVT